MTTVLTGIKPTGSPHIGNYLGAIRPALDSSKGKQAFFFIADYHALTTQRNPQQLRDQTYEVAATWLACGLDPAKITFYKQSDIPEIFELTWILSCMAEKGLLNRAHAYKALVEHNKDKQKDPDNNINVGLFQYPILMAADILLFNCNKVPVGQDQKQHVEIARDIAQTVNHYYGDILTLPEPIISNKTPLIPGIDGQKMSKSYDNTIPLFSTEKERKKRIMQIATDSTPLEDPKDPDNCTVIKLYEHFATDSDIQTMKENYRRGHYGYGHAKEELANAISNHLAAASEKYQKLINSPVEINTILQTGTARARKTATTTLSKIKSAIGIH